MIYPPTVASKVSMRTMASCSALCKGGDHRPRIWRLHGNHSCPSHRSPRSPPACSATHVRMKPRAFDVVGQKQRLRSDIYFSFIVRALRQLCSLRNRAATAAGNFSSRVLDRSQCLDGTPHAVGRSRNIFLGPAIRDQRDVADIAGVDPRLHRAGPVIVEVVADSAEPTGRHRKPTADRIMFPAYTVLDALRLLTYTFVPPAMLPVGTVEGDVLRSVVAEVDHS